MDFLFPSAEYSIAYILVIATLKSPRHCYSLALPVFSCFDTCSCTWIISLPCPVRRWQTYACPRITLCLSIYIPVCQCVTHACFRPCLLIKPCKWILMPHHGRKFNLTVGGDNKYKISHEQFWKGHK